MHVCATCWEQVCGDCMAPGGPDDDVLDGAAVICGDCASEPDIDL